MVNGASDICGTGSSIWEESGGKSPKELANYLKYKTMNEWYFYHNIFVSRTKEGTTKAYKITSGAPWSVDSTGKNPIADSLSNADIFKKVCNKILFKLSK